MYDVVTSFIHTIFIGFIALFPVINPVGTAFVVDPYFNGITKEERKGYVLKITLYVFYFCAATLLSGNWILQLFGLSVPVVKIAGGIVICKIGWDLLSGNDTNADEKSSMSDVDQDSRRNKLKGKLFYPITFPISAGPGVISVLFTLSTHHNDKGIESYLLNVGAILIAVVLMCILVYAMYLNTNKIIKSIGEKNRVIVNKIIAFLIFCVGLQIASGGVENFLK